MESQEIIYHPNLNKFSIPQRSLLNPAVYLSLTIEEIEQLTLNSGPRYDMANYILDEVYACTLWDHLQQNLFTAQKLKEMAREHC